LAAALFRQEVREAQKAQWLGSIRVASTPGAGWVTAISVLLACSLLAFALWGEVTRKARLPGMLVPAGGLISVPAQQAGTLTEWLIREADVVSEGQALAHVRTERQTRQGDAIALQRVAIAQRRSSLEAELRLLDQQGRQRHDALADRMRSLAAEERQAMADQANSAQRVRLAQGNLRRFEELASSGYVSTVQAQQRQEELLDLQSREAAVQRQIQGLQREQQSLQAEQAANGSATQASRQQLQRALSALAQEDIEAESRQGMIVIAPASGRVSARLVERGQTVQSGQTLLTIVPASRVGADAYVLEAHLYAPSRAAGFVQPGQQVWLRYAAYPYQKFGMAHGEVLRVSETPVSAQELPIGQAQGVLSSVGSAEPMRRVTVRLKQQVISAYGERVALTAGLALEADVVQERRAIWEWLLEPLLARREHLKVLSGHPNKTSPGG
jgi:membrane fusion protein